MRYQAALRSCAAMIAVVAAGSRASAQSVPDAQMMLSPQPISDQNPLIAPKRDYVGVASGSWMLYPSVFAGMSFDDNLFSTRTNRTSDVGLRLRPSFVAVDDSGIHKSVVYAIGDLSLYKDTSSANLFNARAGFTHTWEVQRDLQVRLQADFNRTTDITSSGQIITPTGTQTLTAPIISNTFTTNASVQKNFGRAFVAVGGSAIATIYGDTQTESGIAVSQQYRNNDAYILTTRAGYWISPVFYGYVEPSVNWRDYYNFNMFNSNGVRSVAGIGTDRISLFRGEIYAGVYSQHYANAAFGTVTSPVVGARLWWYPLEQLTVSAQVDESAADATFSGTLSPVGAIGKSTTASLTASYTLSQVWSATARAGLVHTDYVGSPRVDDIWTSGLTLNYNIWRNLAATFDYQFASLDSTINGLSYTRNIVSVGMTYKY